MTTSTSPGTRPAHALAWFAVGAAVFAVAYCQAPLYYSNQNQYFLQGLANAGHGLLQEDWLANTEDPTPIFSGLVAFTARYLHPWVFHLCYALVMGAYAAAMVGIFRSIVGKELAARRWPIFFVLFVAVHSALARWGSYRLFGQDYPWYLQGGVAGQYVLGAMFQPSTVGVFLIVAICLFVRDRPFLAAACLAIAATVHTTYLLAAALVTLGFLAALLAEGRGRQAVLVGAWTLALVLPVCLYVLLVFGPSSADNFDRANDILVNVRIPHHSRPDLWFDEIAAIQLGWIVVALILVWRTKLFLVLAVPFLLMILLTLVQVATGSDTLALLFPWRVSAVLVPVATTAVLSRLVDVLGGRGRVFDAPAGVAKTQPRPPVVSAIIVGLLMAGGVWISAARQGFHTSDDEVPLMDFVRRSRAPGDLYFLPVRVPDLVASTRGSLSSDFKPLAEKKRDARIIPVDLQRFRLHTGTPIFVDFKSIPYKDTEVIEWHNRLRFAQAIQEDIRRGRLAEVLPALRERGVTHLVVTAGVQLALDSLEEVYADTSYRVLRLRGRGERTGD